MSVPVEQQVAVRARHAAVVPRAPRRARAARPRRRARRRAALAARIDISIYVRLRLFFATEPRMPFRSLNDECGT